MADIGLKVEKDAEIDGNTTVATMQASGKVDLNASNNTANGRNRQKITTGPNLSKE